MKKEMNETFCYDNRWQLCNEDQNKILNDHFGIWQTSYKMTIFDKINIVMNEIKNDLLEMNYIAWLFWQILTSPIAFVICIIIGILDVKKGVTFPND